MALVKFGAGIADMRGSIGGTVFARNRAGATARNRTKPTNPNTGLQQVVRQIITLLTTAWSATLSVAQRSGWSAYAAAVAWTNSLGEQQFLTGFNMFVRSNSARLQAGLAQVLTGPVTMSLAENDPTLAATMVASSGNISLTFDNTLGWAHETGGALLVKVGSPVKVTRNFFAGPWRYAGKVLGNTTTAPTSPQTIACPFTVAAGQRIFVECRITRADGRLSNPFRCYCTAS